MWREEYFLTMCFIIIKILLNWGITLFNWDMFSSGKKKIYLGNTHSPTDLRNCLGDARVRDGPKFPLVTAERCRYRTQVSWITDSEEGTGSRRTWESEEWVQIPPPPLSRHVILDKLLLFSELQFSHLGNGNADSRLQGCRESQQNHTCQEPGLSSFFFAH